jgi:heat shock protein HslJ
LTVRLLGTIALAAALVSGCFTTHDILVGPAWSLIEVEGEAPGAPAQVTFAADGTFDGRTPCSPFSGTYHLESNRILLDSEVLTGAGCAGDAAVQEEEAFLAVLENRPTYAIDTGTGRLRVTGNDRSVLLFEAR